MPPLSEEVQQHYSRRDLGDLILDALQRAGKDLDGLSPEDLAPIDEFHIRGRAATVELAQAAGIDPDQQVLDVGCGIGGTSRSLAGEFGCRVVGIDLTEEYCRVAQMLTERVGLSDLVEFHQGDATRLPFAEESFDITWSEHAAMNIPDKRRLYEEMYRVLKPGGTVAIYDILAGPTQPVIFPVPWARTPDTSFLVTPEELRKLLQGVGFRIASWTDNTNTARDWFLAMAEKIKKEGLPPLGFHLLLGPDFATMAQNQGRNLQEGRIVLAQVVGRK
ncbi:MAG: methyltransferase domain-containing protein [Actinomycetota bacterium]|nr:methyltransferase domain-containing protein [Actinomycetota bacterium]